MHKAYKQYHFTLNIDEIKVIDESVRAMMNVRRYSTKSLSDCLIPCSSCSHKHKQHKYVTSNTHIPKHTNPHKHEITDIKTHMPQTQGGS